MISRTGNWRRFVLFRVLFNARFYYPVLAVFFLDLGLSATQYTLLNFAWAFTVLSFKGLAFNLGYGFISLAFAGALRALRADSPEETFGRTLPWLPVWLGLAALALALGFWRRRGLLTRSAILGAPL